MVLDELTEKMLRCLVEAEDSSITTSDLANEANMSISSIKSNLKNVKNIISSVGAKLISTPGIGIQIESTPEQLNKLKELIVGSADLTNSYYHRKQYILDILFQRNSNYTIQLFADDLLVGKNIILKDFERLEKWLKKYDISIDKVRNLGVVLKGSEFNIRQAIIKDNRFYHADIYLRRHTERPRALDYRIDIEFNEYFQSFFSIDDLFFIQDLIWEVEDNIKETYTDSSFCQLTEYLAIMSKRIRNGYYISSQECVGKLDLKNNRFFKTSEQIVEKIRPNLKPEVKETESQFLAALLISFYTQEGNLKNPECENYFQDLSKRYVGKISHILNKGNLLANEELVRNVASFFEGTQFQKSYNILIRGSNRQEIKNMIPSIYAICLAISEEFEKELEVLFNDDDLARLAMIINNTMTEFYSKKDAVLVTASDQHTSKYIANKITNSIRNLNITDIFKYNGLKTIDNAQNRLIISTVPLPFQDIIQISKNVTPEDVKNIEQAIMIQDGINEFIENDFRKVFAPELMIKNFNAKNKNDVISYGCSILNELGYVDKSFESQILERELITPTSIGNLMAVPHGYSSYLKKCGVAVIQLKRQVDWTEEDRVDLVFLMAINFVTAHEVYDFFRKFYAFIDNPKNIENLKNAADEQEMYEILTRPQSLNP